MRALADLRTWVAAATPGLQAVRAAPCPEALAAAGQALRDWGADRWAHAAGALAAWLEAHVDGWYFLNTTTASIQR